MADDGEYFDMFFYITFFSLCTDNMLILTENPCELINCSIKYATYERILQTIRTLSKKLRNYS